MRYLTAVVLAAAVVLASCGDSSQSAPVDDIQQKLPNASIQVVESSPLELSIGHLAFADSATSDKRTGAWVIHDVLVNNTSDAPITYRSRDTSVFADADKSLGVATGFCGFGQATPDSDAEPGNCAQPLAIKVVQAHASGVLTTATLVKGLNGMAQLSPGSYTYSGSFVYWPGDNSLEPADARTGKYEINYVVAT